MLKNNKIHIFFAAFFLLLLCLAAYGDILTHQFMIDERLYVKPTVNSFTNERIYLNPNDNVFTYYQNLGDFFSKSISSHHYAPFYFLLNVELFRLFQKPFPLYFINLLLFYFDCGLLFIFIYLISEDYMTALLTSVFFCIHPMTGDILQHITFNILLVQNIFIESGLIALYLYAKKNRPVYYYIFSLLMFFLGIFCHEIIVLSPIYAAALLFFLTDLGFKKIIKLIVPFILLSLLLVSLWLVMVNTREHLENIIILRPGFLWSSIANFSHLFFWYLGNLFVPRNIVFMCSLPPLKSFIWLWNLFLLAFLTGCGTLIFCYLKRSLGSFALVLFLIGFIFAVFGSQARLQDEGEWVFEPNWIYFSSIGFYLFIVLVLLKLRKYIRKLLFMVILSAFFIYYFISTLQIDVISRTEKSYSENWLRKFPGNFLAMRIVARYYANHKDLKIPSDLVPDMLIQVDNDIKDDDPDVLKLVASVSSCKISFIQRKELSYKLSSYYCKNGLNEECEESIHHIIAPKRDPYAYIELSYALYQAKAYKIAVNLLKQCITLYPKYKEPYLLIGVILANEGHYEESINFWKEGSAIDPSDLRFVSNIDEAKDLMAKSHLIKSEMF